MPWALALVVSTPLAIAHPLPLLVFVLTLLHEPFTRYVETNTNELTWLGRLAWIGMALVIHVVLTAIAFGLFRLRGHSFERFARARVFSQLGYLLLVPLAYLMLFEPFEGNIVGFLYAPYYLLATAVGVTVSLGIQGFLFLRRPPAP